MAFVEKALLPEGFEVRANERVYNDEGAQIAELDVEIRGRIGSTNISWLIECRDRPGDGPAPGAWIEQLVGRRTRFGFNKVTAVSTTGFAGGAVEFALSQGIELREVKALEPEAFENWLMIRSIVSSQSESVLRHATVLIDEGEDQDHFRALGEALTNASTAGDLLRSSKTGTRGTLVLGSKGELIVEPAFAYDGQHLKAKIVGEAPIDEPSTLRDPGCFVRQADHFAESVFSNREPGPNGAEGLKDMKLMAAIYRG